MEEGGKGALEAIKLIRQPTCGISLTLHEVRGAGVARGKWGREGDGHICAADALIQGQWAALTPL